jgi:hypothetical protein
MHSPHMNAAIPLRLSSTEEISGVIEWVTFHNDKSGFCVLRSKNTGAAGVALRYPWRIAMSLSF